MPSARTLILRVLPVAALCLAIHSSSYADNRVKPDSGKFTISLQDSVIGTDTFKIDENGNCENSNDIALGAQKIATHSTLKLPMGKLTGFTTDAGKFGKMDVVISGNMCKTTATGLPEKKQTLSGSPHPYGNFSPDLLSFLIADYDEAKGGFQQLNAVAIDGASKDGVSLMLVTVSAMPAVDRIVAGKTISVLRYGVVLPGPIGNVDTVVYLDKDLHVLYWYVPGQKLAEIREGYEDLAKPEKPEDPLLSKPTFTVKVEHRVMISMRDGVKLAADIYRPDADGKFPVILQRTPYGRGNALEAAGYAKRGYVFVAQDVRGRFDSEGDFHPFVLEAKDGYDSVEWCAAQPWSTGDVGMIGASYVGFVQWAAAREGSKHLKCLIPIVSPPDPFFNVPYMFGELFLSPDLWWASVVRERGSVSIESPVKAMSNIKGFETLPLTEVDKAILGEHQPIFQEWLKHSTNDAYYGQVNFDDRMSSIGALPVLNISGWFDGDGIGTKLNYAGMIASGHANQKLVYGPWTHEVNTTSRIGKIDFGPQSLRDLDTLYLRWFDRWLKGIQNGVEKEPPVDAFIMGINQWRTFSTWPPKVAALQKWYFHSDGRANGDMKGGSLSTTAPGKAETPDRYVYNPADPYIPGGAAGMAKLAKATPGQSDSPDMGDRRSDTLWYTTPALTKSVIVAGPISVHLVAASSARDTDWYGMLQDVFPDGHVETLCQGIIRARFRSSFSKPTLLTPGKIDDYKIDLWALGNAFQPGHKIRVVISSSCFPIYARNLNTGGDIATDTKMVIAKQAIYHDAGHSSYILLPVLDK